MSKYLNNTYSPSMNAFDKRLFYLQNLPSIVCSYILQPQSHHMILDMCAAPVSQENNKLQKNFQNIQPLNFGQRLFAMCVWRVARRHTWHRWVKTVPKSLHLIRSNQKCWPWSPCSRKWNWHQYNVFIRIQPRSVCLPSLVEFGLLHGLSNFSQFS